MADLLRQLNEETPTRRVAQWAGVLVPPLLDRETIALPREEPLKDQLVALHTSRDSGLASTWWISPAMRVQRFISVVKMSSFHQRPTCAPSRPGTSIHRRRSKRRYPLPSPARRR